MQNVQVSQKEFSTKAMVENVGIPAWFREGGLGLLERQPDEQKLITMAERLWPRLPWMSATQADRNRVSWYKAVIRQRKTVVGWVLDERSATPSWGNPAPLSTRLTLVH
ncbi:MAG TPA: hypothetical protein VFM18_20195 [Methanosarcina sp.]|nr:hypothetical protein [Methanosarcina sp.]